MKKILFINRQTPHGTSIAQEALDVLLMASTFVQDISVLFLGDGVLQLKTQQDTSLLNTKNFSAAFKAFPLYDIEKVYVEKTALEKYGLTVNDLLVSAELLNDTQITELMAQQDSILNF